MRIATAVLVMFNAALLTAADGVAIKGDVEHELQLTAVAIRELPHVETTCFSLGEE